MDFLSKAMIRAKSEVKTIVLPEGTDPRIIKAARYIVDNKIANIILLGKEENVKNTAAGIDLSGIRIIDPLSDAKFEEYTNQLYELRKQKGITLEEAKKMMQHSTYFGVMLVYNGVADGMVSGATHSTADTLRPALQIIKTNSNSKLVSTFFVMVLKDKEFGQDGILLFSDCGLLENPDAEQLSEIAICSSKSFENLVGEEAKVAMLSYSTYGSAQSEMTQKVINATKLVKEKCPEILVDGELQLDSAIIPEIAEKKAKGSQIKGRANVLIFPDLNAGNIGYKLVERLAKADAYGPMTQGLKKPVNDLSRGSTVEDIIGVITLTAVQAQLK